ncbi:MAG TPA: DUF4340 domain-containing protein [Ideonella sp.]|nr:DUF4340 domain-containing protein [Ideonella sp.]
MHRWIPLLAFALVLQVAAAVALDLRGDRLAAAAPGGPLVAADLKGADRLVIDGPLAADGAGKPLPRVELVRKDGRWQLPASFGAPADAAKVGDLLGRIAGLRRGLPVATSADAAERFAVDPHRYERRLVASHGAQALATLFIGTSPGLRRADARVADQPSVYSVDLAAYELPTGADEWLDTRLLHRDAASLASIEVAAGDAKPLVLERVAQAADGHAAWRADGLDDGRRLDASKAAALADAIANLKVDRVLGTAARAEWQQDRPELTLTLKDAKGQATTWTLSKARSGDTHVLKASDRPWYLELKSWNAQPLLDAAARDKLLVAAASH